MARRLKSYKRVYVMTLAVLAPYRGYGIGSFDISPPPWRQAQSAPRARAGTKLVKAMLEALSTRKDVSDIYLHVQLGNDDALKFYSKVGRRSFDKAFLCSSREMVRGAAGLPCNRHGPCVLQASEAQRVLHPQVRAPPPAPHLAVVRVMLLHSGSASHCWTTPSSQHGLTSTPSAQSSKRAVPMRTSGGPGEQQAGAQGTKLSLKHSLASRIRSVLNNTPGKRSRGAAH